MPLHWTALPTGNWNTSVTTIVELGPAGGLAGSGAPGWHCQYLHSSLVA
jgi:hypothetical protein